MTYKNWVVGGVGHCLAEIGSPATDGSRSASSADAAAQETLGNGYKPAFLDNSCSLTSGKEKRRTTFIVSPTI